MRAPLRSTTCGICAVSASWRAIALYCGAVVLAGQAAEVAQRQAVAGHYNVPSPHPSPQPTASPDNLITNPGFETSRIDGGWYQCGDVEAYTTASHPHSGAYDEYSGTRNGVGEPQGNSGVCEAITIPARAMLTAQLFQLSNEPNAGFSYQEADLLDDHGNVVVNLYKAVNNKPAWARGMWNLGAFAGRTYWLYFGVHGDGSTKFSTQQFLDDVILTGSSSPPPE
jgi:hypothetical protein